MILFKLTINSKVMIAKLVSTILYRNLLVLRTFLGVSSCATMPGSETWPVKCSTSVHIWQRSLVYSCATMPDPEPWPIICSTSVHSLFQRSFNLGDIPATSRSCSTTGSSLSAGFHDRSKTHGFLTVIDLPFPVTNQLECSFFWIRSDHPSLLFRLLST